MSIVFYLLGLTISIQDMAALFNIIDLWFLLKSAWPKVLRRVLLWTLLTAILAVLAGSSHQASFFTGLASGPVVLIINYLLNRFILSKS